MDRRFGCVALLCLLCFAIDAPASSAARVAAVPDAATTRHYAACFVTDPAARKGYASDAGRIDVVGDANVDAQGYATWVATLYNLPQARLATATCVSDPRSLDAARMRLRPLVEAAQREGLAITHTRWWLSQ